MVLGWGWHFGKTAQMLHKHKVKMNVFEGLAKPKFR